MRPPAISTTVPLASLGVAGLQAHAADGGDRRQRLAAEAQGGNREQIVVVFQLAGGMALKGQQRVVAHHSAAVVGDVDELAPAGLDVNADARGSGVQGVLDQLLDHRGRTLHDFAGGDFVGDMFGENVNAAHTEAAPGFAAEPK